MPAKFIVAHLSFVKNIDLVEGNIDKIVATHGNAVAAQGNNSNKTNAPCPPWLLSLTTLLRATVTLLQILHMPFSARPVGKE